MRVIINNLHIKYIINRNEKQYREKQLTENEKEEQMSWDSELKYSAAVRKYIEKCFVMHWFTIYASYIKIYALLCVYL